jgi:glycosyltransferase involved in cell wall biosynthesis
MHIGLNAHLLSLQENYRGAGINWYIYNLLQHLPSADPDLRYTAFLCEPQFSPPPGLQLWRPHWSTTAPLRRMMWEQLAAPFALRRHGIDLFHAMAFVAPLSSPCPTVVTVLDLSFFRYPSAFTTGKRLYLQLMTRLSARRAAQVIAISDSTRRDVIATLGISPSRVQTVYCGIDERFRALPPSQIEAFRGQKGLPDRFILFLGTIEPRKNVTHLVEAFARLCARHPNAAADLYLVIAGAKGWLFEPLFAKVSSLGLEDRVLFPGYVPEKEKEWWYNAATCFCYPSLYEGFGLPPLEAMACGVPVITSDTSSLPEVVGEAGLMRPPQDIDALSTALHQVMGDPDLRAILSEQGKKQAAKFSWAQAAQQTAQIYRRVLGE